MRVIPTHLMPQVWGSHHRKGLGFDALAAHYASLPMQPLRVTAKLLTNYAPNEPSGAVHLDGLLALAVAEAHPCPFKHSDAASVMPLPLKLLWQDAQGKPLYASGNLMPDTEIKSSEYWHKRYPNDKTEFIGRIDAADVAKPKRQPSMNANNTAGRYKDYRTPLAVRTAKTLDGLCVGNLEEVSRLLQYITHVGKKGSQGFGRVVGWTVEPCEATLEQVLSGRALPVESGLRKDGNPVYCCWTPPYWHMPWAAPCLR